MDFFSSKLNWSLLNEEKHRILLQFYQTLIQLRKQLPALKTVTREYFSCVQPADNVLVLTRGDQENTIFYIMNFNHHEIALQFPIMGQWHKILDSSEVRWLGEGATLPDQVNETLQGYVRAETVVVFSRNYF